MREVAAAEKCGTNTVTKVTNSLEGQEEMRRLGQEHTERLRDQFRAIAEKGLKTLAEAVETDPHLAFKMARGAGSVSPPPGKSTRYPYGQTAPIVF